MDAPAWLWIPLTIWAGFAQTLRNAAQRHLIVELGTLGATLVRFVYGLPFALLWFGLVAIVEDAGLPAVNPEFLFWVIEGGVTQIVATALLLRVMHTRNFALGVAYTKTELMQVAIIAVIFLDDPLSLPTVMAITVATFGVLMLSPVDRERPLRGFFTGWTTASAALGFASGGCFALAAVGYRGAALTLDSEPFLVAAGYTLVWAQAVQVLMLGGWLLVRSARVLIALIEAWRPSVFAGFMGTAASAGWFTAMAIEPVAHVRTLGLVELLFSLAVSRRLFQERLLPPELAGVGFLLAGLALITLAA